MSVPLADNQVYTFTEYMKLPGDRRYEIIDGLLYAMSPAPSIVHQRILRRLLVKMELGLAGSGCEVFCAPLDVLLPAPGETAAESTAVVQPDLLVICDPSRLQEKYCLGAPELVVEITSPASYSLDYVKKLHLYERHGVKEYWIVNYTSRQVLIYRLSPTGGYGEPVLCRRGDTATALDLVEINLGELFTE